MRRASGFASSRSVDTEALLRAARVFGRRRLLLLLLRERGQRQRGDIGLSARCRRRRVVVFVRHLLLWQRRRGLGFLLLRPPVLERAVLILRSKEASVEPRNIRARTHLVERARVAAVAHGLRGARVPPVLELLLVVRLAHERRGRRRDQRRLRSLDSLCSEQSVLSSLNS